MSTNNVTLSKVSSLIDTTDEYVGRAIVTLLAQHIYCFLSEEQQKSVMYFSNWVLQCRRYAPIYTLREEAEKMLITRSLGRKLTGKHLVKGREIAQACVAFVASVEYDYKVKRDAAEAELQQKLDFLGRGPATKRSA